MFSTYLLPVQVAVTLFPLVTALIMVPAAVHGYRRRGRPGGWPVLVFYSFVFYLLAALLQTVMPLPAHTSAFCSTARYAESPQLEPFDFYPRLASASGGDWSVSILAGLPVTWTTVLNALLLFPLGIYLRYYLRKSLLPATGLAFATSLFFEMTQYTGLWFVYACPLPAVQRGRSDPQHRRRGPGLARRRARHTAAPPSTTRTASASATAGASPSRAAFWPSSLIWPGG